MNETRLSFSTATGARPDLAVRASADGIACRCVLSARYGDVLGETSAFGLPPDARARLGTYRADNEGQFISYTAVTAPTGEYSDQALFATDGDDQGTGTCHTLACHGHR